MTKDNLLKRRLLEKFREVTGLNPQYSLRALARDIGVSHSLLSQYLNGRIELSPEKAYKIGLYLKLSERELWHAVKSTLSE